MKRLEKELGELKELSSAALGPLAAEYERRGVGLRMEQRERDGLSTLADPEVEAAAAYLRGSSM